MLESLYCIESCIIHRWARWTNKSRALTDTSKQPSCQYLYQNVFPFVLSLLCFKMVQSLKNLLVIYAKLTEIIVGQTVSKFNVQTLGTKVLEYPLVPKYKVVTWYKTEYKLTTLYLGTGTSMGTWKIVSSHEPPARIVLGHCAWAPSVNTLILGNSALIPPNTFTIQTCQLSLFGLSTQGLKLMISLEIAKQFRLQ